MNLKVQKVEGEMMSAVLIISIGKVWASTL